MWKPCQKHPTEVKSRVKINCKVSETSLSHVNGRNLDQWLGRIGFRQPVREERGSLSSTHFFQKNKKKTLLENLTAESSPSRSFRGFMTLKKYKKNFGGLIFTENQNSITLVIKTITNKNFNNWIFSDCFMNLPPTLKTLGRVARNSFFRMREKTFGEDKEVKKKIRKTTPLKRTISIKMTEKRRGWQLSLSSKWENITLFYPFNIFWPFILCGSS